MLVRLFDPVEQFQNKGGALNTAGRLEVYLEGTDDLAQVYVDEEGLVPLQQPVILDNNGRSQGLYVESNVKYRIDVRTRTGDLLFTVRNMRPGAAFHGVGPIEVDNETGEIWIKDHSIGRVKLDNVHNLVPDSRYLQFKDFGGNVVVSLCDTLQTWLATEGYTP
jgi:hypothetical protein